MFAYSSIERYHTQLKEGTTTCVEAVQHYLDQINASRQLNAFIEVYSEEAMQRAAELDKSRAAGRPPGKLHGVVIGLKDVICHEGHRVTAASAILSGFVSLYSATAVQKLLEAEAIIIGRLNCDEFGMGSSNENSVYGCTLNPLNEKKVPGGSSGGSAAAVKAGLCMCALGSDTGGSVRQPADFCGVIGMKPGYGRVSRYGLIAYASSFDQIGILANHIADIALVLETIAGPDEYDSTVITQAFSAPDTRPEPGKRLRFAFLNEAFDHPGLDQEIAKAIRTKLKALEKEGHEVRGLPFELFEYVVPAYYILTTAEASSNLARYDGVRYGHRTAVSGLGLADWYRQTRSEGFGKEVKRRIMLGTFVLSAGYRDAYFRRAQQVRRLIRERMDAIFEDYDFVIMPTIPYTAFNIGDKINDPVAMYLADIYTVIANLGGYPAISLPLFRHSNGMPFGLQVMSNRLDEVSLLKASGLLIQ